MEHQPVFYWENAGLRSNLIFFDIPQRRVVVEHVKAPAESAEHEVVFPLLDGNIPNGDGGQTGLEGFPVIAAIRTVEAAELRADKQQVFVHMVFGNGIGGATLRQNVGNGLPTAAPVCAFVQVRFEIAVLVVVEGGIHHVGVVLGSQQEVHIGAFGHAGYGVAVYFRPGSAAVFGDLYKAVIRTCKKQGGVDGAFVERHDVAVRRGAGVFGHSVDALHTPHDGQSVAVYLAGEIGADGEPGVAVVVAAEELVGSEVEPAVHMGGGHERGVPVPTVLRLACAGFGLYAGDLAACLVVAHQYAVLRLGINDVGVFGVNGRFETIAAVGHKPIGIDDAMAAARAGRPAEAEVVLCAAVDIVERLRIVHGHFVKLGHRQVGFEIPGFGSVECFVNAAVAAHQVVVRVFGVYPHGVVVHMFKLLAEHLESLAAVVTHLQPYVHGEYHIGIVRMYHDLAIIIAGGDVAGAPFPARSAVGAAEKAALVLGRFHDGVDHLRIGGRRCQADAANIHRGQAFVDLVPGFAAVFGFVHAATGASAHIGEHVAAALECGGVEHLRVAGVHEDVVHAGVFVHGEHGAPGLTAIGSFIHTSLSAFFP